MVSGLLTQTRQVGDLNYGVQSDIDETASIVANSVIACSSAEGETPQQMAVIESQGGGVVGETFVRSGRSVKISTTISGADTTIGVTGI